MRRDSCCRHQGIKDMIGDAWRLLPRHARWLLDENCRRTTSEIVTIRLNAMGRMVRRCGVDDESPDMVLIETRNLAGDCVFASVDQNSDAAWGAARESVI